MARWRLVTGDAMFFRSIVLVLLSTVAANAGPLQQGVGFINDGEYDQAIPLLETAAENPGTEPEAVLLLTQACNQLEDWESGIGYGKRAVKLMPETADAHYQYAVALRIKMSNVGKARAMFTLRTYKKELKQAIKLDPTNIDALTERIGFLMNAPGIAGGDLEEAEKELIKLEKLDWLVAKQMQLGIEVKREDNLAAINVSKEILRRYPDNTDARSAFGYMLQQKNLFKEADVQFAQLVESDDTVVQLGALYQRGRGRILGNFELLEAIGMFETYIERLGAGSSKLPSEAAARWRIGMAYKNLGQIEAARDAFEWAVRLDPDLKEARKSLKELS